MLSDKLQQIEQHKSKLATLEQALLKDLHAMIGFASRANLVKALLGLDKADARPTRRRRKTRRKTGGKTVAKGAKKAAVKTTRKPTGRRKRTKVTPQLRNDIIAAVKSGATGKAIAGKFGVSVPTVQNIKKAAGLTRKG